MKITTTKLVGFLGILALIFPQPLVFASSTEDEFNPDYIISDDEMQNWQTMTRADIQAFLEEKDGYIKGLRTDDKDGTRRLASDIIYRAAKEHGINPKYLLVKLQKEQSLITDDDPTQKQLDGATGYGITDGCGWSCEMYKNNKGFGKQVDSAAGIIRWYYENMFDQSWIKVANKTYTIDGEKIIPRSNATAFLYTYTPHLQGNENFWKLWNRWFQQVYPDGSLIKAADSSKIYLLQNGMKRPFASMTSLVTRFDPKLILTVPSSELNNYETGPEITLPNYAILKNGSQYYLLDYDTVRPFTSYDVVKYYGYHPDEFIEVTSLDLKSYTIGTKITKTEDSPLGRIVKIKGTDSIYFVKDNQYQGIIDKKIIDVNFPNLNTEDVDASTLSNYQSGPAVLLKDGTLFGVEGSNKIYVTENGKKRHIANEEVFLGMGYKWENIIWINQFAGMAHPTGEPIYVQKDVSDILPDKVVSDQKITDSTDSGDEMHRTPEDEISFVGKKFETKIDTYLVADYETEEILSGKNIDVVRPTASLAKPLTAYVLLNEGLNTRGSTTYDPSKHKAQYHYYKVSSGDKILNKNLMEVMLVSSLNTPVFMLVSNIDKDYHDFVVKINNQLDEWKLSKTHFADIYGGDEKTVATAREYLKIFKETSRNTTIKEILGMKSYEYDEIVDTDGLVTHSDNHSNNLVGRTDLPYNIIASKTGFTYEAGSCLAMIVERKTDGKKFVIITMGNPDSGNYTRFNEPEALSNWAMRLTDNG